MEKTIYKVSDIPDEYTLVQNSQDITACLEDIGRLDIQDDVGCLFVEILDGEYGSAYYCEGSVPWLNKNVYQIQ